MIPETPTTSGSPKGRLIALGLLGALLAGGVVARAIKLQLIGDERLVRMSEKQFQSQILVKPRRGLITDRNGEALAINLETRSLAADPSKMGPDRASVATQLSRILLLPKQQVLRRLSKKNEFVWIKRHLNEAEVISLEKSGVLRPKWVEGDRVPTGLFLVKESKRVYPHGELAAQVVGTVNLDSEGIEGVELLAEKKLRGEIKSVKAIKDALGRPIFIDAVSAKDVRDGQNVQLTLDSTLQYSVETELRVALERTRSDSGIVMVMDATTGDLLAIANEPGFNPNHSGAKPAQRRNRAVTDGYEPGSTIKPLVVAGALSQGMRLTDQLYGEKGSFLVQGKRISEAESHEKFEWINLKKLIQVSSNVAAAKLALKLGSSQVLNLLQLFGLGGRTGIAFPGEIGGNILAKKSWQPLTTANIGFGQGILVTPIQMLRAYAVLANGGWLVQPRLIDGFPTEAPRRVLTDKTIDQVVEALVSVTQEGGTGTQAHLEGFRIAGKTGTAQVVDPKLKRYSRSRYIPSFIGFLVGATRKIVIFTSLDYPKGIYYASETAAPLFKNVMESVVNRYSIPATEPTESGERLMGDSISPKNGEVSQGESEQKALSPEGIRRDEIKMSLSGLMRKSEPLEKVGSSDSGMTIWKMPTLQGLTAREALQRFQGQSMKFEVLGEGLVSSQVPEAGKTVTAGGTVRLILSSPQIE